VAAFCFAPDLPLFELARVLMRLDHIARFIENADHCTMRPAEKLRVVDCVANCARFAVPQPTEWEGIENQIDAAMIFAGPDFVKRAWDKSSFPSGNRVSFSSQIFSQFHFHLGRRLEGHRIQMFVKFGHQSNSVFPDNPS
jgi:hypothetical protein